MKLKAFLEKLNKQAKLSNEDFNKLLEAFKDESELPDAWVNLVDDSYLTRERAVTDQKVINHIRSEVLDGVDSNIKEYYSFLDDKDKTELLAEPKTFNKLKMLKDAFGRTIERIKTENPSNDEKVKELQKQAQEYVQKMTAQQAEFQNKEKELRKTFDTEKISMRTDWTLDKKLGEFTFADEFKEVRPQLTQSIIDKIKKENVLILDENGDLQVHEKTESGATKQKFINGNEPVTIDKLLEEPLGKFLKKNNGGNGGAGSGSGGNGSQGREKHAPNLDPSKMTLQQLRQAGLKTQGV